jgi:nucleotide-binding universal stress UspA family protein
VTFRRPISGLPHEIFQGRVTARLEADYHDTRADTIAVTARDPRRLCHAGRAAPRGAELVVVHAWDLPVPSGDLMGTERYVREWRAAGAHLLSQLLTDERRAYRGLSVEATVVHAQAAHALVAAAAACDLLVLGRRSRGAVGWSHLGATARAVLREARVPVEVVPLGEGAHR